MASRNAERATVTIPAAYLEDVRRALVDEIAHDNDMLVDAQANEGREDQDSSVRILGRDVQLLKQLAGATGDTTLTAPAGDKLSDPLAHMLEGTVRLLSRRLADVVEYGPLPMGDVVDIAARLRWAADEAIRVCPDLAHRLTEHEAVA